ncbi:MULTISPECIES: DNA-processing protein DprA [Actinoalloteichus]|uniref:DNA protecting protein DprA n=1 Tax=Actinoalloteichus fjordicus TaxID=1612552 RepID=A0AAC9LBW8_9PSEU|nr:MULTISPECIES: DNA-processing protein DprA [Actinoalloteichus]APU13847.1 DNA protecting protein DprA [Actinoalloteichus fjordicus]APU19793.1 DNA protecting protein DprA [Actinoalloteichus sp. GBA129-24]
MTPGELSLLLARAYLLRVAEPPAPALTRFVVEHGAERAAEAVRGGRVPGDVAKEVAARNDLRLAEQDLQTGHAMGARLLVPEHEQWPRQRFADFEHAAQNGVQNAAPPLALWVRGSPRLAESTASAVSVVGSRAASGYGEQLAAEFGHGLVGRGFTVVSGAAYGIDGAAHRGALAGGGTTVAVLACGLDVGYPAGHTSLLRAVESGDGAVLSEYPPGTPPARHRFLVRNRLIAALSAGTVVVEAGRRSGARNTAGIAGGLGRVVMAVPGPVTSALSAGCHELLRDGEALLVTSTAEIAEAAGPMGDHLISPGDRPSRDTDGLGEEELRVFEALDLRKGAAADEVSVRSGVELASVRAILPVLEFAGLAARGEYGWTRRRRRSGRS